MTAFNPLDGKQAATVVDNKFLVWDLGQEAAELVTVGTMQGKGQLNALWVCCVYQKERTSMAYFDFAYLTV